MQPLWTCRGDFANVAAPSFPDFRRFDFPRDTFDDRSPHKTVASYALMAMRCCGIAASRCVGLGLQITLGLD
jgi:hypothetical protein